MLDLRWAVVARPRRGGRDLPEQFTFQTFCDWIRHELEAELERQWEIEMNGVGVPDTYASGQRVISSSTRQKPLWQPFLSLSLFNSDRRFDSLSYRSEIEQLTPTQLGFRILDWEVPSMGMHRLGYGTYWIYDNYFLARKDEKISLESGVSIDTALLN